MTEPKNLMPDLTDDEYDRLKRSIGERGVLIPVEIDADTGEVLDGHHRRKAAEELGIDYPVVKRSFKSDAERTIHALILNIARRQLGPVAEGVAIKKLVEARRLERGGSPAPVETPSLGGRPGEIAEVARELNIPEQTARNRIKLARDLEGHPDLAARVDAKAITQDQARREVANRRPGAPTSPTVGDAIAGAGIPNMPERELHPDERAGFDQVLSTVLGLRRRDPEKMADAQKSPDRVRDEIAHVREMIEWGERYIAVLEKRLKPQIQEVK